MSESKKKVIFLKEFHSFADDFKMFCESICVKDGEGKVWDSSSKHTYEPIGHVLYSIKNTPGYLDFKYQDEAGFSHKKYPYITGYAICLDGVKSANDYLNRFFSKKNRGNILRAQRKLMKCFDISYESYYGQIDKIECQKLLNQLKAMIVARFDRRGEDHEALGEWSKIEHTLYPWILDKKASLFVLRNGLNPLSISICYHYGPVLFSYVTSYDINYSKFSLGNIMILKKLDWCLAEGGYRFIEMGWGYLDYKARWANTVHTFEHHLIFPMDNFVLKAQGVLLGNYSRLIASLQNKWYYQILRSIKAFIKDKTNPKVPLKPRYQIMGAELTEEKRNLLIPINPEDYPELPLEEVRNHFVYLTEEYHQNITVMKDPVELEFYVKNKKQLKRIVFEP